MSKYEVGDNFIYIGTKNPYGFYTPGKMYQIALVHEGGQYQMTTDDNTEKHWWCDKSIPESFEPARALKPIVSNCLISPIREVTRKELVAGVYGRVDIDCVYGESVNLRFLTQMGATSGIYSFSAKELRDAARVFNDIADFLEGRK